MHYEKAVTDKKDKRNNNADGVGINKDSANNTYITRWHTMKKNDDLNLLFVSNAADKTCTYQITETSKEKGIVAYHINGEGQVIDWDANEHLSDAQKKMQQKQVNDWLKYF